MLHGPSPGAAWALNWPGDGCIAQLVEQLTLNQRVAGSSPATPTNQVKDLVDFRNRDLWRLREFCGTPTGWNRENDQLDLPRASSAHAVRRGDEARQLGGRVVCCDPRGAMPEEILPILKAHPGCSQASPKGMLQIVHAHLSKFGPNTGALPGSGHHAGDRLALIREDVRWIDSTPCLHG